MLWKRMCARAGGLVCVLLLLTQLALAGSPAYVMTIHDGFLGVRDSRGHWLCTTAIRADTFSDRDQLLLKTGVLLRDRAAVTRALEDFCS